MKCPLFATFDKRTQMGEESDHSECLQEECAWWDQVYGLCTVLALSPIFTAMGHVLGRIHDKMPKDFPPRG